MKKTFSLALMASLAAAPALANNAEAAEKPWSITAVVAGASNLKALDDVGYSAGTDFVLAPSYKVSDDVRIGATFSASQALSGSMGFGINDGILKVSHGGWDLAPGLHLSSGASVQIPLSSGSRDDASLYTAVQVGPSLSYDLGQIGLKGLSAGYSLSGTKNFHQYTQSLSSGSANTEFKLSNGVSLGYSIFGISLSGSFGLNTAWTYTGSSSTGFSLSEELGYGLLPGLNVAVGHANGGAVTRAYGTETNISFYNPDASTFYGSLSYTF